MQWPRCSAWLWANLWLDFRALGLFRVALGAASLVEVTELLRYQVFLEEKSGLCPLTRLSDGVVFDLYLAAKSSESVTVLLALNFLAALCFMLGYWTRLASCICWVFAMSQHHRLSNCVEYGGDRLRSHLFFWCLFQPLGHVWSVDAFLSKSDQNLQLPIGSEDKKDKAVRKAPAGPAAPLSAFLILFQLASMYEYTASTKNGQSWAAGDAVFQTLQLTQYAREPVASILAMFPSICHLFTHATLYIEKYGWILAFLPFQLSRAVSFSMFFALHLGLNLCLRVGNFQLFVLSAWCAAVPRCVMDCVEASVHHRWPRSQKFLVTSPVPRWLWLTNLLGFWFILIAMVEGCLERNNLCSMTDAAKALPDFGGQKLIRKLGLLQRYNMFSPDPPRTTLRVQLYGILASPKCEINVEAYWTHCEVVEFWTQGFPSVPEIYLPQSWANLSAPVRPAVDFATNRWRKLVEKKEKAKALGGYMCSQWKAVRGADLLGLWLVRVSSEPPQKETFTGDFKYWCSSQSKSLMLKLPPQPWTK